MYESKLIKGLLWNNSSNVYKYIRSLKENRRIPSTVHFDSSSASTSQGRADIFNSFFHSVFIESSYSLPPGLEIPSSDSQLSLCSFDFSDSDVYEVLVGLDTTKAVGIDGIGPNLLKSCALALCEPLCHLFQTSLSQHQIPAEWRIHNITPVHKSGDKAEVCKYRPISLLCSTSKVLERLIYDKCIGFLIGSISPAQYGFLKSRSSLQQLLVIYRDIMDSLAEYYSNFPN